MNKDLEPWSVRGNGFMASGVSQWLLPPFSEEAGSKNFWWKLVWCHERCHKAENRRRCQVLRDAIMPLGGKLMALKKAAQFITWMQSGHPGPYILITDWREAQPLMKGLQTISNCPEPFFTVVLCSGPRQVRRSSAWVQELPPTVGPVCTCRQDQIPTPLLNGVIHQYFGPPFDEEHSLLTKLGQNGVENEEEPLIENDEEAHTREPSEAEKEQLSEEPDDDKDAAPDRDKLLLYVNDWAGVPPFPDGMPAPMALIRGQDAALVITECSGTVPRFTMEPWMLETPP